MTVRDQPADQRVAAYAVDRCLAGGVDVRDRHHVGIVEGAAELGEEVAQP